MFDIIIDTREQKPLEFEGYNTAIAKLETGDYSIGGKEELLCIERKGSLVEFYRNCTQQRFTDELERMKLFKYKFLVIECTFGDIGGIPYTLGLPKSAIAQLKVKPAYIFSRVGDIQIQYGIHVIFAGDRETATDIILNIMKKVNSIEGV